MKVTPSLRITGTDNVRYLRVSTKDQVNTDYNPEGISIPAQRKACLQREREVDTMNVAEFIDPGKSGKGIADREDFQAMVAYIKAHPNVKYVSVYALSRLARNRYDDAIFMMALEELGVTLISATERNLDDTPTGKMLHGVLAVINEYNVNQSGADIAYKMSQKVIANGGTLGRARLGYRNVREEFQGRRFNTIAVDEQRAPLVRQAFELFATDEYTEETLLEEMTDRGLTMPKTLKLPERPVSKGTFGEMLRNRYYIGEVWYKDAWHPGRHTPLISRELFDKVQAVLDSHSGSGIRTRKHHHFLKGCFWCGRCGKRLTVQRAKGNGGVYYYFFCLGIKDGSCDQPYVPFADLEREMLAYYGHVRLTDDFRREVASKLDETLLDELAAQTAIRERLHKRLKELDQLEDRIVDQLGDPDWPQDKLKAKVAKIRVERGHIAGELEKAEESLEVGRQVLRKATELLAKPQRLYRESGQAGKRLLTRTLFHKLFVDTYRIVDHELHEPFRALVDVQERRRERTDQDDGQTGSPSQGRSYARSVALTSGWGDVAALRAHVADDQRRNIAKTATKGTVLTDNAPGWDDLPLSDLLELGLQDGGSNTGVLVGRGGVEPPTFRFSEVT
jgi:site-specific DNA recombinase